MTRRRLLPLLLLVLGCADSDAPRVSLAIAPPPRPDTALGALFHEGVRQAKDELADQIDPHRRHPHSGGRHRVAILAPTSRDAVPPWLQQARAKGLRVVVCGADPAPELRDVFIDPTPTDAMARCLLSLAADAIGGKGRILLVGGDAAAIRPAACADHIRAAAADYPACEIVETLFPGDAEGAVRKAVRDALDRIPRLSAVVGLTPDATRDAVAAVLDAPTAPRPSVTGVALPKDMRVHVRDGAVAAFACWSPVDVGYLAVHAAVHLGRGELPRNGTVRAGRLGELTVADGQIVLAPPLVVTARNIAQIPF